MPWDHACPTPPSKVWVVMNTKEKIAKLSRDLRISENDIQNLIVKLTIDSFLEQSDLQETLVREAVSEMLERRLNGLAERRKMVNATPHERTGSALPGETSSE